MADSKIEWTDKVWNPVTGCTKVSQGCKNCYAETLHDMRHKAFMEGKKLPQQYSTPFSVVRCHENRLTQPLKWKKPSMIFVNSMSDLFHEDVSVDFIARVFAIMFLCWVDSKPLSEQHQFQILTKRPERFTIFNDDIFYELVADYANDYFEKEIRKLSAPLFYADEVRTCFPLNNVWLGVSVEDQKTADVRIPQLLNTPANVRFVSAEPLLSQITFPKISYRKLGRACSSCSGKGHYNDNFKTHCPECKGKGVNPTHLDLVICGGESGKKARPMHPGWARSLRDQCGAEGVIFFFKQWGEFLHIDEFYSLHPNYIIPKNKMLTNFIHVNKKKAGRLLDGVEHNDLPEVL